MLHFYWNLVLRIFKKKYIYYYYHDYYYFQKVCQPSQGRGTRLRTGHQSHPGGGQARLYQRLVQGSTQKYSQDFRDILGVDTDKLDFTKG